MNQHIQKIFDSILDGDRAAAKTGVQTALEANLDPLTILNEGMIGAMAEVGHRFEIGEYFVPEMLVAARAMQEGMTILKTRLVRSELHRPIRVVAGTVEGDLHDIGKNLVCLMLEGAGFEIIDLGTNVSPAKFVDALRSSDAPVLALSALLTTTMPKMKTTIQELETAGLRSKVKVVVGGAPITAAYASQIGADGFATDASRAVNLVKSMVGPTPTGG